MAKKIVKKQVSIPSATQTTVQDIPQPKKKVVKKRAKSVNSKPKYKWDVISAEKEYLSDVRLSYDDIAKKYGVGKQAVQRYGTKNGWSERRQQVVDKGLEKFENKQADIISEANERHLKLYKNMQSAGNGALVFILKDSKDATGKMTRMPDVKDMSGAAHVLKQGIEGERTVLGLPTMIQGFGDQNGEKDIATWTDLMLAVMEADKNAKPPA